MVKCVAHSTKKIVSSIVLNSSKNFVSINYCKILLPTTQCCIEALQKSIKYPTEAKRNNIEGRVIVQCLITINGEATEIKILQGIGYGCDEEAKRVISKTKFIPGKHDGKNVPVITTIPVLFKLF